MDNQLIILAAAGLATVVSLGVLLPKPEHVLFSHGVALGFPDLAMSAGAINIRADDCLLALLLFRLLIWPTAPLTFGQRRSLRWQIALAGWCVLSVGVGHRRRFLQTANSLPISRARLRTEFIAQAPRRGSTTYGTTYGASWAY